MAGVQRGGSGEVECEREARRERAPNDRASHSHSTSPLPPLCTPAMQATLTCDQAFFFRRSAKEKQRETRRSVRLCYTFALLRKVSPGGGGGGTQKSFIREGSAPRSNPLPFYIPFFQKRHPFRIPFIGKRHPFHIPCNHCHWPAL